MYEPRVYESVRAETYVVEETYHCQCFRNGANRCIEDAREVLPYSWSEDIAMLRNFGALRRLFTSLDPMPLAGKGDDWD